MGYFFDDAADDPHGISIAKEIAAQRPRSISAQTLKKTLARSVPPVAPARKPTAAEVAAEGVQRFVAAAGAAVPEGLDARCWRAVVAVMAADESEQDRHLDLRTTARLASAETQARCVLARYAIDRFVHGYSVQEARRRLGPDVGPESANGRNVGRWLAAYEAAR